MAYTTQRARYEHNLERAHRAMFRAAEAADELGSPGAVYDCNMICYEITRLAEDSLREKPRHAPKVDNDRAYL